MVLIVKLRNTVEFQVAEFLLQLLDMPAKYLKAIVSDSDFTSDEISAQEFAALDNIKYYDVAERLFTTEVPYEAYVCISFDTWANMLNLTKYLETVSDPNGITFPQDIYIRWLKNVFTFGAQEIAREFRYDRLGGFIWLATPEGHIAWQDILQDRNFERWYQAVPKEDYPAILAEALGINQFCFDVEGDRVFENVANIKIDVTAKALVMASLI